MSKQHKRIENRIRVSEEFKKFVLARCGDADTGEWLEKQIKSSLRREAKYEDYEKKIAKLEAQQPQCQPETSARTFALAVRTNDDLARSVWTPTEIIRPSDIQIVKIGDSDIRISATQKEKKVWKDGHWIFSMKAAGDLSFLDSVGELGEYHAKELNKIKADGLREMEIIKIEGCQARAEMRLKYSVKDDNMQETPHNKYDPAGRAYFCPYRGGLVYLSECEACTHLDCKHSPKGKQLSVPVEQPQTQGSSEFECPFDNKDPETCLNCQKKAHEEHERHANVPYFVLDCPKIKNVLT